MRFGILADAHGHLQALSEVLQRLRSAGRIIYLGDAPDYGTVDLLEECLDALHNAKVEGVRGNCDSAMIRNERPVEVSPKLWDYYRGWPSTRKEGNLLFVHGGPRNPESESITNSEKAWKNFHADDFFICFHGHSHCSSCYVLQNGEVQQIVLEENIPYSLDPNARFLIGVGSVGEPRDEERGSYLLFDQEMRQVTLIRIPS